MTREPGSAVLLNSGISVYIDSYDDKILSGTAEGFTKEDVHRFRGLFDLFLFIESTLNKYAVAEPYTGYKRFVEVLESENGCSKNENGTPPCGDGLLATFKIKVLFRRNASWQGTVLWLEGKSESSFRSALELAFLMDSALSGRTTGMLLNEAAIL